MSCYTQANSKNYYGHSAHVTSVKFTHNDEYLLSTGGDDSWWVKLRSSLTSKKCDFVSFYSVFVWKAFQWTSLTLQLRINFNHFTYKKDNWTDLEINLNYIFTIIIFNYVLISSSSFCPERTFSISFNMNCKGSFGRWYAICDAMFCKQQLIINTLKYMSKVK